MRDLETEIIKYSMNTHFSTIAHDYRELRNTDKEPIFTIQSYLGSQSELAIVDIGSGTGRYDELLIKILGNNVMLTCVDNNQDMLDQLYLNLAPEYSSQFKVQLSEADKLPFEQNYFGATVTFNAIHHFQLSQAIKEFVRITKPSGYVFIYTRTHEQNKNSIWGRYFPKFTEKENRLFNVSDYEKEIHSNDDIDLLKIHYYQYSRVGTLDTLVDLAKSRHYSTFYLYEENEFEQALEKFISNLLVNFPYQSSIKWIDRNILLVLQKK